MMEVGGYTYACRPVQSIDRASSAHAWSSGTGDTYRGSFLFLLLANRFIIGKSQILRILWTIDRWGDHPDGRIWFCLDRESGQIDSLL